MGQRDDFGILGVRAKLDRALHLLEQLEPELDAWSTGEHIDIAKRLQPEPHVWVYHLVYKQPMPVGWSILLGEIVHNLRSALDNAVYLIAVAHGGDGGTTAFPIFADESEFKARGAYRIKSLPEHARSFIESVQPFSSEAVIPHVLRSVDKLWNLDKHRAVQPWGIQISERSIDWTIEPEGIVVVEEVWATGVIHHGTEALRMTLSGHPYKVGMKGHLTYQVAIDDPTDPAGKYDGTLMSMYDGTAAVAHVLLSMIDGHPPYSPI